MKRNLLAILVFTVLLFLWSGFTQILPWGVPTAQKITVQSEVDSEEIPSLIQMPPNGLTTNKFDITFNNKISTYTTDKTFSWIVTQPLKKDYSNYFIGEVVTQFIIGVLLTLLLILTKNYQMQKRMLVIGVFALAAWVATYGQLINWWAIPPTYAIGIGVNLIIGWLATCFIVSRFILKFEVK